MKRISTGRAELDNEKDSVVTVSPRTIFFQRVPNLRNALPLFSQARLSKLFIPAHSETRACTRVRHSTPPRHACIPENLIFKHRSCASLFGNIRFYECISHGPRRRYRHRSARFRVDLDPSNNVRARLSVITVKTYLHR